MSSRREALSAEDRSTLKEELSLNNILVLFFGGGSLALVVVFGWDILLDGGALDRAILFAIPGCLVLLGCFIGIRMRLDLLLGKKDVFSAVITDKTSSQTSPNKVGAISYFLHFSSRALLVNHDAYCAAEIGDAVEVQVTPRATFVLSIRSEKDIAET